MKDYSEKELERLIRLTDPDELWDVYDADGNKTGRVHRRAEPLRCVISARSSTACVRPICVFPSRR